jgi:RND superfamily putative drug exporter
MGAFAADHARTVMAVWAVVFIVLAAFAPRVETSLSGAGWQAYGSDSVRARETIQQHFPGLASSALTVVVGTKVPGTSVPEPVVRSVERVLRGDPRVAGVTTARAGRTTVVVTGGAGADPTAMVAAADDLKPALAALATRGLEVSLTGSSGMWSDFNEANRSAMMKSELLSWPVTMAIIVLAFGSLVAAGLPLLLTILGLVASAGVFALLTHGFDISIWAMNFALMFSLALGIDYALFVVHRFRGALFGSRLPVREAVAATMDTAGKAVLFSGLTVLVSLSAVLLVPSPAFRSTALGIIVSVVFVLAATLTLLPAVLAKLGPRVDALRLPWVRPGETGSPRAARWGERLWRRAYLLGAAAAVVLVVLAAPVLGLRTEMPSIAVIPSGDGSRAGYEQLQQAFGPGAPAALAIVAPEEQAAAVAAVAGRDPGVARVIPAGVAGGVALVQAIPDADPASPAVGATIDRLRAALPPGALVGGQAAENHDLAVALRAKAPLLIGIVLTLGFLLLLVVIRAPWIAALAVVTNLLATAAAFGVGRLIFQDGHGAGLLGFTSQGHMDAWAPVFFFAMAFAISMDYTVFLLANAREHWDRTHDPRQAVVGGLTQSGRVIFAAAAVMVAVFFTFALSGPLPPKEMGVILGISVLLDAMLVRLVLLPALMRILGRRAWALPRRLGRVLPRVRFDHA